MRKIKKNKVLFHAVADKLLAKWSPRELLRAETEAKWLDIKSYILKVVSLKQNVDCNFCRSFEGKNYLRQVNLYLDLQILLAIVLAKLLLHR